MPIRGYIDAITPEHILGWVAFEGNEIPQPGLAIDIMHGANIVGTCTAVEYRPDLKAAGIGDGQHGFVFKMPLFFPRGQLDRLQVRVHGTNTILAMSGSSTSDSVNRSNGATNGRGQPETLSQFGGLWIDRRDWLDRLAFKVRQDEISDDLSTTIFRFVRDGYVILPNAITSEMADRLAAEIDRSWHEPPLGLLIETFEPNGKLQYIPPKVEYRDGRTKLLDIYVTSLLARTATASPKVIEFLNAIFEDKPKAFQSLMFWKGSEQAIHKDTAYVKIDTSPLSLAATWLALEDIQPGTGELEYYVGSHRAPDYCFGGYSKWMEGNIEEHPKFLESLHSDAKKYKQKRSSFLAKKGDVLIWHADLAHGGSPIKPPLRTRKSLVTHFTGAKEEPYYRRTSQCRELDLGNCVFVSNYTDMPFE